MYRLAIEQMEWLLKQPETGMGFQEVRAHLGERMLIATAYNAELLLTEDESKTLLNRGHYRNLLEAKSAVSENLKLLEVLTRRGAKSKYIAESDNKGPATEGKPTKTTAGERFARFTAYMNDRRIRPGGSLLPGTYATTADDARLVSTGREAVDRYALPDPKPAKYRFRIAPREATIYRQGIVQPDFGHEGGGVEVLFDEGTNLGSVTGPDEIPEK